MNDLVSIVVPVYNAEAYLEKCVESIENQTYKYFELILVDDGSSDSSGTLCDELCKKYGNISVIHQKNFGASTARNKGIDCAKGKYIVFCDSDDYIAPEMLQKLTDAKQQHPEMLPVCGIKKISSEGEKDCLLEGNGLLAVKKCDFFVVQKAQLFNAPVNKLFEKNVLDRFNIRFDRSVALGEDLIFNADYVMKSDCDFAVVNEPLYFYDIGVSNSASKKYLPDILENYMAMDKKFRELIEYTKTDMAVYSERYASILLFNIVNAIKNTMSPANPSSSAEKIKYIKKIISSFEVEDIVSKADRSPYSDIYLKMLCSGNAGLIYTFRTIRK